MPPPPPPPLMDDLVEEILLRLPASSPASLVRAGLVCKRWCHLVSDPGFQRRFREFHRRAPPPMAGFLVYSHHGDTTRFVPKPVSGGQRLPQSNHRGLKPGDSRHGRVLLYTNRRDYDLLRMIVWNPITGEHLKLPEQPRWDPDHWTAAVLCTAAAAGGSACDHLNCHREPFIVVLVGTRCHENFVCVYSSSSDAWSEPTFAPHSGGSIQRSVRSVLVRNTLYFSLREFGNDHPYRSILEFNLGTMTVSSVVKLPEARSCKMRERFGPIEFTTMEDDGRLGFVRVEDDSRLCLWSREVEEPAGWVLCKDIELGNLLPCHGEPWQWASWRYLAGSAEGVGIIFLRFKDELFTIDLKSGGSGRINQVYPHQSSCLTVPYMNFCTPVFRAPSSLERGTKNEHLK